MDLCTWDWGAIGSILGAGATFIAAGVALYIFTQWKNQKASEVVANEAKYTINEIFELNKVFLDLVDLSFNDSTELKRKIDTFISLTYSSLAKLAFIENTIFDDNGKIAESISDFHDITEKLISIFTRDMGYRNINIDIFIGRVAIMKEDKDSEIAVFNKYAIAVLENCKRIAMYKVQIQ